jgi:hypothetical protein
MPKGLRTTARKNGKITTFPKAVQGRVEVYEAPAFPGARVEKSNHSGSGAGTGIEITKNVSNGQAKEARAFQGKIKSGLSLPDRNRGRHALRFRGA